MRERGTQTRCDHLETSSGEMSLRPGCSCQATIITINEEEREDVEHEDGDGAGGERGGQYLRTMYHRFEATFDTRVRQELPLPLTKGLQI